MGSVGPGTQTYISSEQQAEMTKSWSKMAFGLALISIAFIAIASSQPYNEDYALDDGDIDYMDNSLRDLIHETPKRGRLCIRCGKYECRCNVFGSNCKCERPSLFGFGR